MRVTHATRSTRAQLATGRRVDAASDACEAFIRWYSSTGHWVYDGRAAAARVWMGRGITTLPAAPINAASLLNDWVEADQLPAWIAQQRADELAARAATSTALWLPLESE
jgi:hypothetical protein